MRDSLVDRHQVERLLVLAGALRAGLIDALAREGAHSAADVAATVGADLRRRPCVRLWLPKEWSSG